MKVAASLMTGICAAIAAGGCGQALPQENVAVDELVGAWRSRVQFNDGAFAAIRDLEFLYVFNAGGTMTESSNYDGAPPVPPAYGVWRRTGPGRFETRYAFFVTRPPGSFDEIAGGGGWMPGGSGVLDEKIVLAADGRTYRSTIVYRPVDQAGRPIDGGGKGSAVGQRIGF